MFARLGGFSPAAGVQDVLPSERLCVCAYQCGLGVCANVLHPKNVRGNFKSQTLIALIRTQKPRERAITFPRSPSVYSGHPGAQPPTPGPEPLGPGSSVCFVDVRTCCGVSGPSHPLSH